MEKRDYFPDSLIKLREFIAMMVRRLMNPDKPAWHTRLMMREMAQPTSACAEWVRDYVRPNAKVLTGILEELLPPGTSSFKRYLTPAPGSIRPDPTA